MISHFFFEHNFTMHKCVKMAEKSAWQVICDIYEHKKYLKWKILNKQRKILKIKIK